MTRAQHHKHNHHTIDGCHHLSNLRLERSFYSHMGVKGPILFMWTLDFDHASIGIIMAQKMQPMHKTQ